MGESTNLEVDLLVIGGGMAGLVAGAYASQQGLTVGLVERGKELGGSALISGGFVWTARTLPDFVEASPGGASHLAQVVIDLFPVVLDWIRELRVEVGTEFRNDPNVGFPSVANHVDLITLFASCRAMIVGAGGWVVLDADVTGLIIDDGRVRGATVVDRDGEATVVSGHTLLATGGFQGSAEHRRAYVHPAAGEVLVRSNPNSDGRGLELALSAGGGLSDLMAPFYGHLVASPLARFEPGDYIRHAQVSSAFGLLLDESGRRFTDESLGYYRNAQRVCQLPSLRALFVGDQVVRQDGIDSAAELGIEQDLDRVNEARNDGSRVAEGATLTEIDELVAEWGYSGVSDAVAVFNAAMACDPERLRPPRLHNRRPLDAGPYFAIEVQPAITFTMGGVRIDAFARVLRADGRVVDGLLAAGADAGGLYDGGYVGGLSMAATYGLQAARTALAERASRTFTAP